MGAEGAGTFWFGTPGDRITRNAQETKEGYTDACNFWKRRLSSARLERVGTKWTEETLLQEYLVTKAGFAGGYNLGTSVLWFCKIFQDSKQLVVAVSIRYLRMLMINVILHGTQER